MAELLSPEASALAPGTRALWLALSTHALLIPLGYPLIFRSRYYSREGVPRQGP